MALLMINILSTPIASMRKGMTSPLIIVNPKPKYAMNPIEEKTDKRTMMIPVIAKEKPDVIKEGNWPMAIPM